MKVFFLLSTMAVVLLLPALALAVGGHDALKCTGCHSMHNAKGEVIFSVKPNMSVNPDTKQPNSGITALCLGCHETTERGGFGILPVSTAKSHPFDVKPNPKVAVVPAQFLRDGRLDCVGCHDPHPSNPNAKYLRVDTKKEATMGTFCAVCHPGKGDVSAESVKVFDSMDERPRAGAKGAEPKAKAPPETKPATPVKQ